MVYDRRSHPNLIAFYDYFEILFREAVNIIDDDTGDIVDVRRNEADLEAKLDVSNSMSFFAVDFFEKIIWLAAGDLHLLEDYLGELILV